MGVGGAILKKVVLPAPPSLFRHAADEFVQAARSAVKERGSFSVVLSGGSTPKGLYSLLATEPDVPWPLIKFYWGDERHVAPDHPDSNYGMARDALLSKIPVTDSQIFRIPGEL